MVSAMFSDDLHHALMISGFVQEFACLSSWNDADAAALLRSASIALRVKSKNVTHACDHRRWMTGGFKCILELSQHGYLVISAKETDRHSSASNLYSFGIEFVLLVCKY